MFLPLGMPRDNGIAYNVAIGYYVQEMRKVESCGIYRL